MDIYSVIHTPFVLILCISGSLGHVLGIGVLWKMLNPTNLLLISMSGSQLALCVNFLYSTLFKYGSEELCLSMLWSYGWTLSLLVSVNFSVLVHMLSTFHVVALSIIRHFSLKQIANINSSNLAVAWFTYQKCIKILLITYISVIIVCTPLYFQSEIVVANKHDFGICNSINLLAESSISTTTTTITTNNLNKTMESRYRLAFSENYLLQSVNFWWFGSICKLIPCSILGLMTFFILDGLKKIRAISARFQNVERERQHHRTTQIILVIMFMFIFVEFPQGILAVAQSLFVIPHLDKIGDLFEMLTLLNSCLIFGLFCSMNSRLRSAFYENTKIFTVCWQCLLFRSHLQKFCHGNKTTSKILLQNVKEHILIHENILMENEDEESSTIHV